MSKSEMNTIAWLILGQVIVAITGFLTLMAVFNFPDILREPSQVRLSLFLENRHIIAPTYFFLAMTGISQVAISVLFFRLFKDKNLLVTLGSVFGILCGIFQVVGFIRWPVLIPYLAEAKNVSPEIVAFVEGAFNRYAGMAIGEHLGFLMQAFWTLFIAIALLKQPIFNKTLALSGIVIGLLSILMSLEPLGSVFTIFGELTNPVASAWYIWLVFLAISLFRSQPEDKHAPQFGMLSLVISAITWAGFVVPAYL